MAVAESSGGDEGDGESLTGTVEKDQVGDVCFADVACTFETVDREEIYAEFDGAESVPDCGAFVQDYAGGRGFFEHFDDWPGGISCGFDYADSGVENRLGVAGVVRGVDGGEKSEIYAKGFVREGFAALDFGAEGVRAGLCEGCEDS